MIIISKFIVGLLKGKDIMKEKHLASAEGNPADEHICKYCGAKVFTDDETCWANPANR